MDLQTLLLGVLIAFLAAVTQSVTASGSPLVSAPLLAVVWAVKPAVATTVMLSLLSTCLCWHRCAATSTTAGCRRSTRASWPFGDGHDSLAGRALAVAISGASGSATSMGAPPVVLYLLGREPDIHRFRATLPAFFLPASVVTLALFIFIGRVDSDVLTVGAAGVPAIVAGVIIGGWLRGHAGWSSSGAWLLGCSFASACW